jgi:hypothetical protein
MIIRSLSREHVFGLPIRYTMSGTRRKAARTRRSREAYWQLIRALKADRMLT